MTRLNFPEFEFRYQQINGKTHIFDIIRKKMIMLTPEEWVRQHFVRLLTEHYSYPKSLIKLESGLRYNKLLKRTDIVIYDRTGACFMIVECKAPGIKIDEKVFSQASVYNQTLKARYIVVSNGIKHFCCSVNHEEGSSSFISGIPPFPH